MARHHVVNRGDPLGASSYGREEEAVVQHNWRCFIIVTEDPDMEESDFIMSDVFPLRTVLGDNFPQTEGPIGEGSETPNSVQEEFGENRRQTFGSRPPVPEEVSPYRQRVARNMDLDFAEEVVDAADFEWSDRD